MALPTFNAKSPTIKRILKEAQELRAHPDPTLYAAPLESNLFEWHFTLRGPPSTPYSTGVYHGRIILPPTYPLRPPSFRFLTPSGRFEVNREICLSISGHHEETWQPAWGIRTALWALRAFMEGDAKGQVGGMEMPKAERERLAGESRGWSCAGCGGRSNEDVLKEEGGEGAETGGEGKAEHVIPEELKFGFRDQMDDKKEWNIDKGKAKEVGLPPAPMSESAATLVQTAQAVPVTAQSPPAMTAMPQCPQPMPTTTRRTSPDGVPAWVDKAITGVVAALVLMILKKILV
ncbi:MAG: hypothetical protein Q9217_002482 [Psora testacea]